MSSAQFGEIYGVIVEKNSGEPLPGANVTVEALVLGTVSDIDGHYSLKLPAGKNHVKISFVSYSTIETDVTVENGKRTEINVALEENTTGLKEVTVSVVRRRSSEVSMIDAMKTSSFVMSGVSAQQINKAQDSNASEVIRRIPGISIIDNKFVVARGLAQRYNNVWINNSAVPSSEADSRSFSFDMIPGQQIENIMIVKSPTPELPADFTGGFVKVETKNMPSENSFDVSYGTGLNLQTHFRDFTYNKGSATDFLGFDNGMRSMHNVSERLDNEKDLQVTEATRSGFNNDWNVKTRKPLPDQRFSMVLNRVATMESGSKWGIIAALNYGYTNRTYIDMINARFGIYNVKIDKPDYIYDYMDDQYTTDTRLGGMVNVTYMLNSSNRIELRNIVNQLGKDRYTFREGYKYGSRPYSEQKMEYIFSSRLTTSNQLAGIHNLTSQDKLEWTAGYAYANKNQPDRRIINLEENGYEGDPHYGLMQIDPNDIRRDFVKLYENIYSAAVDYKHDFMFDIFNPSLKVGAYTEYRNRNYSNREFFYRWNSNSFLNDFGYGNVFTDILVPENYAADKLYVYEDTDNRNSYSGKNQIMASYISVNIPIDRLNINTGVRYENNSMTVTSYTRIREYTTKDKNYSQSDFFPSVNATYNINKEHLVRAGYGASINRQEFREVSASVYYDFDLFSDIKGNPDLKPAYIQNFDIRYEFYPHTGELISLALFYKRFQNPIEWTYIDGGGSYTFTFENAKMANNKGIELDIKKSLDFINAPFLSFTFNGALIDSKVKFDEGSLEHERQMQGQSPYIVNAGLFYQNMDETMSVGLLYNIIGKRIVGIGRVDLSNGSSINNNIPDMYEMPRNGLDLTFRKKFGKRTEFNASIKDIISEPIVFKQFPEYYDENGVIQHREQITKFFKCGQNVSVGVKIMIN